MKPMNFNLKNAFRSGVFLMLTLFTAITSYGQCVIDTPIPGNDAVTLPLGVCDYDYVLPVAGIAETAAGDCTGYEVYLGRIDDDLFLTSKILVDGVNTVNLGVGTHTLYYYTSPSSTDVTVDDVYFFEVQILPGNGGVACNDGIQVTLDLMCSSIITPDMVLEGDYCYQAYTLTLEDPSGNTLDHDDALGGVRVVEPGIYSVTVTGPFGNYCWSSVNAEDKISNNIADCGDDHILWCAQTDLSPGADIIDEMHVDAGSTVIGAGSTVSIPFDFSSTDPISVVTDINAQLTILAQNIKNVRVELESPAGNTYMILDLFSGAFTCSEQDADLILDDSAHQSHSALNSENCGQGLFAYCGEYASLNDNLAEFVGESVSGMWQLHVENLDGASAITIQTSSLTIEKVTGQIQFPTFNRFDLNGDRIDPIWTVTGDQSYNVEFPGNACSDIGVTYLDIALSLECVGDYLSGFDRIWTFTDDGGREVTCTQNFLIRRYFIDDVIFPPNYDGVKFPAFSCEEASGDANSNTPQIELDDNGYPAAVQGVAGYPQIPLGDLCSNFLVTVNDVELPLCGNSYKLIRKWTVTDWCTGDVIEHDQVIKVEDNLPVIKSCPLDTLVFHSDPYRCATDIVLDPEGLHDEIPGDILFTYDCSGYEYYVEYLPAIPNTDQPVNGPFIRVNQNSNGTYTVPNIDVGLAWIRYVFVDECGNTFLDDGGNQTNTFDDCRFEVRVIDKTPPNPVCIEYTVATLGPDGCSRVNVESFDNGSFDNCGVQDFRARVANSGQPFTRMLEFCCSAGYQCGSEEEVELIVFDGILTPDVVAADLSNVDECINYNNCFVHITFQDDIDPIITTGPANVSLDCDASINNLTELLEHFDASEFNVIDNCVMGTPVADITYPIVPDTGCGGGSTSFTWTVNDGCGNEATYQSTISFGVATPLNLGNVQFPYNASPIEIIGCAEYSEENPLSPEALFDLHNFGGVVTPQPGNVDCSTTAIRYEDTYFYDVQDEGVCTKIVRTWTVIDWCAYDPSTGDGEIQSSQIIKLIDNSLPTLETSYVVNCETDVLYNPMDNECKPFVKIILDAKDDCADAEDLIWDVSVRECSSSQLGSYTFDSHIISGHYYHGDIEVTATVTDFCGNQVSSTFIIEIPDCKPPTPYCISDITTVTLPANLTVEVWATDFDFGSYDDFAPVYNCPTCPDAGTDPLEFYLLDPETGDLVNVLHFDCTDIPDGEEVVLDDIQMWVVDPNGAPGYDRDYCTVTLVIQDNENDACDANGSGFSRVSGNIHMVDDRTVDGVLVTINSNQPEFPKSMTTSTDGDYDFDSLPVSNLYSIVSDKNNDILNGVSTLDILLIQRHLLNLAPFSSPYQYIAADANNTESVSAADMVAIRNVILERTSEYVNGQTSWRFVDAAFNFNVPTNPFPFDEDIDMTINSDQTNQDFIAVKIGDINSSAEPSLTGDAAEFRGQPLQLNASSTEYNTNESVSIDITADNFDGILGMQYTLNIDPTLEFAGVTAGVIDMNEDYLGLNHLENNRITVSWNTVDPVSIDPEAVLFTLEFLALGTGNTSTSLTVDDAITRAEAYDSDLNILSVSLGSDQNTEGLVLHQNTPNPFSSETVIGFSIPSDQFVQLSVYDVNGQVVKQINGNYPKGYNMITLTVNDLPTAGVYYYQMSTDEFLQTRKMIIAN